MELDTNPSLTLARTLTLSTGERSSGYFTFNCCYDTTIFNFAYMNSPKNLGRDPGSRSEIDLKRKKAKFKLFILPECFGHFR